MGSYSICIDVGCQIFQYISTNMSETTKIGNKQGEKNCISFFIFGHPAGGTNHPDMADPDPCAPLGAILPNLEGGGYGFEP